MKVLHCPLNGPRNILEFVCAGELRQMPDPGTCGDAQWADHVWFSNNPAGIVREWWCHLPTAYWFIAERNTVTDEFLRTYPASELFKERLEFQTPKGPT